MKSRVAFALVLQLGLASVASSVAGFGLVGCEKKVDGTETKKSADLPPLTISDDTKDLMLTWIDGRGGTHVEVSPNHVPDEGRRIVRVIVTGRDEGTSDPIYVTDLTKRSADGTYDTHPMTRHDWENEIERRRGALASLPEGEEHELGAPPEHHPRPHGPSGDPLGPGPQGPGPGPQQDPPADGLKNVQVIIYGASWCGPCHMAQDHLKKKHVPFVFKDVDEDHDASAEMSAKLQKAGGRPGSIPVIDVGGRIMVGYDERALDQALDRAAGGTAL